MKTDFPDQKLRFGALFWAMVVVTTPVVLFVFAPWKWNQPSITIGAACVGLPILFSIPVYLVVYFVRALLRGDVNKNELTAFCAVLVSLVVGVLVLTHTEALKQYKAVGTGALACTATILFRIVKIMGASE